MLKRLLKISGYKMQDTRYRIQDTTPLYPPLVRGELKEGIAHRASIFTHFPIHPFTLLLFCSIALLLLTSCAAKRVELPDYEGADIRKVIAERSSIKGVNATLHIEFEKNDSAIVGDAALTLTDRTLELRIYSMGFLMAEIKEMDGIIKSAPPFDRNKKIILVEGLRNSILWWLIKDYEVEEQSGNYHIRNSSRKIVIDKKTMLPASQTIELDGGKELRISYEEPANSNGFWYPSKMKIELSKYVVKLQIKSMSLIPHSIPGPPQQP